MDQLVPGNTNNIYATGHVNHGDRTDHPGENISSTRSTGLMRSELRIVIFWVALITSNVKQLVAMKMVGITALCP